MIAFFRCRRKSSNSWSCVARNTGRKMATAGESRTALAGSKAPVASPAADPAVVRVQDVFGEMAVTESRDRSYSEGQSTSGTRARAPLFSDCAFARGQEWRMHAQHLRLAQSNSTCTTGLSSGSACTSVGAAPSSASGTGTSGHWLWLCCGAATLAPHCALPGTCWWSTVGRLLTDSCATVLVHNA